MSTEQLDRTTISRAVRRIVVAESRLAIAHEVVSEDEPLNGSLLRINSLSFVGMLVQVEDDLDVVLSDDLFVGRSFNTVADLVDVIEDGCEAAA
jgi:acyl carrier protein